MESDGLRHELPLSGHHISEDSGLCEGKVECVYKKEGRMRGRRMMGTVKDIKHQSVYEVISA